MRTYKIVLILLIGLVLVAVAAVAALVFVDPSIYRNQLEKRASAAFDRQFKIDGPIRLERSLRPRIIIEDISIGNPEWATDTHFVTAEKVAVQVALFPLLLGELRILDVAFSGVDLFIEEGSDGADNYTFGDRGDSETAGVLPQVEQLLVKDTVINYRTASGSSKRFEISEARLWNIPGEPERIEGRGSVKGKTFTILLAADNAAELSGPQNPWSLKLDLQGRDMSLTLAGRMAQAFKWDKSDYRITISGKQADSLESLFDVEFPTTGPFEISWALNVDENSYRLTDLVALVHGPSGTPEIRVTNGEASGGQDDPLEIALQGQYGDTPFSFIFESAKPFADTSQTTPWPIEAQLSIADTKLNIQGTVIPATAAEHFELDAQLQGETLQSLARLLDTELPKTGPYQFSFHTQFAEGNCTITDLKGTFKGFEQWKTIRIVRGKASALESGSVRASIDAKLDNIPLSLSLQVGPGASGNAGRRTWPVKLAASASGATLKGDGSVVTTENRKVLQIATRIKGNRFESLGPLIGVSLPALGKFNMSADVSSDGDVHAAKNLKIQMGTNRLTGNLRWEDKTPRPFLTGKLSSDRLTPGELLDTTSKSSSKTGEAGLLDRPIKLDGLKDVDAKLDLIVKRITGSPIPVANVRASATLANGELSAAFRANVAGAPMDGQIQLSQRKKTPGVSLKTTIGRIDVGQTLKQLKISDIVSGTADVVNLDGSSTGKTLRALGEQAVVTLQIKPANLSYTAEIANQKFDIEIESATLGAHKDQQLTGAISGTIRGAAFNAEVSTANLREIWKANTPLPLRVALQTEDVQFKAEGSIARPFENNEFELQYELAGSEIEGLDPLADFAVPLRGKFRARGRITGRGNRFTYEEDLRIGKSDLKADITVLREAPRPKITGRISATQIHMDDVDLFDADKETTPAQDKTRVIPDYTLPIDHLLAADLDLDIKAERIRAQLGDLGEFVSKVSLKDGRFKSSLNITGFKGAQISSEFDLDAAVDPPLTKIRINAKDLNFGYLLSSMNLTNLVEGQIDLLVDLSGSGATRYSFLGNAAGRITIIGGPGQITGRRIDLWAADLIPTMLSTNWQRDDVTETNCVVAHIELKEGLAEIEDLLLDTQRITIAASGILNLETEGLNLVIAPRPKRPSLVSLANP
ncbi:MAG: AsmA family protein, partial [Desulfobacterales bacterium]|nr:AsmA family protein [Desulfobacterales bacterium]